MIGLAERTGTGRSDGGHSDNRQARQSGPVRAGSPRRGAARRGPTPDRSMAAPASRSGPVDQVPAVTRHLIGRELEVGRARAWVGRHRRRDEVAPVVLIDGPPGVGRSALARTLAGELASQLPGPRLWVRLSDEGRRGRHLDERLRRWLLDLGVPEADLPEEPEALAERFHRELDRAEAVVVVEDAASADEVEWLRPPRGSVMIVTSRSPLPGVGLDGVRRFGLRPLGTVDALKLLSERGGWARLAADPGAARAILRRCEQLPLALVIAGAAVGGPGAGLSVGEFARRLGAEAERVGGDGVEAVLTLADHLLPGRQAQALRALGLLGLPTIEVDVLAEMLCVDRSEAGDRLEELADAGLVDGDGRPYRIHGVVLAFARSLALQVGTEAQRRAVLGRALAAYRDKADLAAAVLGASPPADDDRAAASQAGARAWAEAELTNLLVLVDASAGTAAEPSGSAAAGTPPSGRVDDGDLAGGEPRPSLRDHPRTGGGPGRADPGHGDRGDVEAEADVEADVEADGEWRDWGDGGPASGPRGTGEAPGDDGRRELAAEVAPLAAATDRLLVLLGATRHLERTRRLGLVAARRSGSAALEGWFAHRLGTLHSDADRHERAASFLRRAVALADRAGDEALAALARFDLGFALCRAHRFDDARPLLEGLLAAGVVDEDLGDLARVNLGYVYRHLGRVAEARELLEESLRRARRRHDARLAAFAERNLNKLARTLDPGADLPTEPAPATGPMPIVQVPPTSATWPAHDIPALRHAADADDHRGSGAAEHGPGLPLAELAALEEALDRLSREALAASSGGADPAGQAVLRRLGAATGEIGPVIGRLAGGLAALDPETPAARGRWRRVRALCTALADLRRYVDRLGEAIAAAARPTASPADLGALAAASEALRVRLDELRSAVRALAPGHAGSARAAPGGAPGGPPADRPTTDPAGRDRTAGLTGHP